MSVQLTSSKRPLEGIQLESNGSGKLQKSAASILQSHSSGSVIRVLCPSSKIGSVIGKGGCIISQIRQETGVRVLVDDNLPGSDERVIYIMCPDRANKEKEKENRETENDASEQEKENKDTNDDGHGADIKEDVNGADIKEDVNGADIKEEDGNGADIKEDDKGARIEEDEQGADIDKGRNGADIEQDRKGVEETEGVEKNQQDGGEEGTQLDSEKEKENGHDMETKMENVKFSGVQKALLLVFEKMVEGDLEKYGGELEKVEEEGVEGNKVPSFVVRLIVFSSQIGCLLGKAGSVIKEMSSESGAQIRIIPRDKLPPPVSASDELVQISGVPDSVKKALNSISQKLLKNPSRDPHPLSTYTSGSSNQSVGRPRQPFLGLSGGFRDGDAPRSNPFRDLLTYRLWCPHDKIGGVIGKGGSIIRALKNETGCEIKVQEYEADSADRVITISGPAHPDDRISAPQDAILRVLFRIYKASLDSGDKNMLAKLLVSSNQIGCLLGKGGSVIAEMRKSTGAYIRILGKDQIPKGASGDEEVVQINGDVERVEDALIQITTRLRDHFLRDSFPSMKNYPSNLDRRPPFQPYMSMREHSPPGRYPNVGQPFHKFDSVDGFHPHDEYPPFMQNFPRPGPPGMPPHHLPERMPNWGPQGPMDGGGPLGLPDYPGGPPRRMGGFGGGNPAVITSTTVEVVVPRNVVPSIYGEDGGCLRLIREISDARVNITDPKPGARETTIIISGTPEQTNAAQSLIQAFVISETESN